MSRLPVVQSAGDLCLFDDNGELVLLRDATDHALASAAAEVARLDGELFAAKRALAFELRSRHGVGTCHAGGFSFVVSERASYPAGGVGSILLELVREGVITDADAARCMPSKPTPNGTQIKSLIGRLITDQPAAAQRLADACTKSPPSVKDVRLEAVDELAA